MNRIILKAMDDLITINCSGYLDGRNNGMNHSDALSKLIKTRYFIEFGKRKKVMALWSETEANKARSKGVQPNEKEQLQDLLFSMYFIETHLDKVDVTTLDTYKQIFEDKFNEIFPLI